MPNQRKGEEYPPKSGILITGKNNPSGSRAYSVNIAASLTGASREQRQFPIKDDAQRYAKQRHAAIVKMGHVAFALTAEQRGDALRALKILGPFELTLEAAARIAAKQAPQMKEQLTVSELFCRFIAAPGHRKSKALHRRPRSITNITWRVGRFEKTFGDRRSSDIIITAHFTERAF